MSTIKYHPYLESKILGNILDVKRTGHYRRKKNRHLSINQAFYQNNIIKGTGTGTTCHRENRSGVRDELLTLNDSLQNMPMSTLSIPKELKGKEAVETVNMDYIAATTENATT